MFVDKDGRKWSPVVTGMQVMKADRELGLNLICKDVGGLERFVHKLSEKPADFVDLMWICCEEQAIQRKVNEIEFAQIFSSEKMFEAALVAFLEALTNFFDNPVILKVINEVLKVTKKSQGNRETLREKLAEIDLTGESSSSKPVESSESSQTEGP
ncbi:MAG: hypothetical protein ACPGLY_27445 [Rubripirellula sp.]